MLYRYQPENPVFKFFPRDLKIPILRHWPPKPVDKTFREAIFVVKSDFRLQELYIIYNLTCQPLSPLSMLMYATHSAYEGQILQSQHWKRGKGSWLALVCYFEAQKSEFWQQFWRPVSDRPLPRYFTLFSPINFLSTLISHTDPRSINWTFWSKYTRWHHFMTSSNFSGIYQVLLIF